MKKLETRQEIMDYIDLQVNAGLERLRKIQKERDELHEGDNWNAEKAGKLTLEFNDLYRKVKTLQDLNIKILGIGE